MKSDPHAVGDGWSTIVRTAAGRRKKSRPRYISIVRYTRDSTFLCMRDRSNHVQQYQSNNQSLNLSIAVGLPCISTEFTGDDAGYIYCAPDIDSRKQQPTARLSHLDLAIASRLLLMMRVLYCTTYTDCSYFLPLYSYTEEFVIKSCLGPGADISLPGQYIAPVHVSNYWSQWNVSLSATISTRWTYKTDKWRWERPDPAGKDKIGEQSPDSLI